MLRRLICLCFVVLSVAGLPASAQTFTPARDDLLAMRQVTLEAAEAWVDELLSQTPSVTAYDRVDPGHIIITTESGAELDLFLDNLVARLEESPKDRELALTDFEATLIDALALDRAPEADPANILPIVRHLDFVNAIPPPEPGAGPEFNAVYKPLAGDVGVVLAYDTPNGIAVMPKISMGIDGLTDDEAYALATSNFATFSRERTFETMKGADGLRFAQLDGNYESSLILMPGTWDALETELGGPVAIAIPTRSVLAAGRADDPAAIASLRALIEEATFDPYSVSEDVFVRRDGEIEVLEP